MLYGREPTIPEYFKEFINRNIDLTIERSIPCPFHKEEKPSFTYSPSLRKWRCWGKCHVGGDIYDLHKVNYGLATREEAKRSLRSIYKVANVTDLHKIGPVLVDEDKVYGEVAYQEALVLANNPDRWIELDYIMQKYPPDLGEVARLVKNWKMESGFEVKEEVEEYDNFY